MKSEGDDVMKVEPQKEHQWLHKLIGEWTSEAQMAGQEQPAEKCQGTETVRSLGGLWVVAEGKGDMPGGGAATMIMTIGYDPQRKRYVGTWVGSMMTHLWLYEGALDAEEKVLTLETEGPDFGTPGKLAKYRDVIEFVSDDHRRLTSHVLGENGQWRQFMTANYRRKK
jgi:uncharacterized protein DUF1579